MTTRALLVALVLCLGPGCFSVGSGQMQQIRTVTLYLPDATAPQAWEAVEAALRDAGWEDDEPTAAIQGVELRREEQQADVRYDANQVTPEGMIEAIQERGYRASLQPPGE